MSTIEERQVILRMLEAGKITADEAARLLAALQRGRASSETGRTSGPPGTGTVRLVVTDLTTGRPRATGRLPIGLAEPLARLLGRWLPAERAADLEVVTAAMRGGERGKVFDLVDHEHGHRVEVFLE